MILDKSSRSTLLFRDGSLVRVFKDTGAEREVLVKERMNQNKTMDSLIKGSIGFRGVEEASSSSSSSRRLPSHMRSARQLLHDLENESSDEQVSIDDVASMLGVKTSTAWQYVSCVVDADDTCARGARRLVYRPLLRSLEQEDVDTTGSLTEVMTRLVSLRGDVDWRVLPDQHAHLRLARLIVGKSS